MLFGRWHRVQVSNMSVGDDKGKVQTQIYVAYRNGRVDQALSLGFLLCWIAGDLTNFVGCYLTNQLPIQIVTAIFYVNMDIVMISQFVYYKLKNQKMTKCKVFQQLKCSP
uniref:Uncharacterized protein n=1 Tax=Bubo bubo TaxID=30461 RepID=A0A8C0EYY5_BUBBB